VENILFALVWLKKIILCLKDVSPQIIVMNRGALVF
jgi:hypothetical protein